MKTCLCARRFLALLVLVGCCAARFAAAQADPHEADRKLLLQQMAAVEAAISSLDIARFLSFLDPNVTITWQNGEVSQGHDKVRAYYERMIGKSNPVVKRYSTKAKLGAPAIFYGDNVAVAYGTNHDTYELTGGLNFELDANWSVTAHKRDNEWKVAALHFSTNLFDNAMLQQAKRLNWYWAIGGVVVGALLAWLLGRRRKSV